MHAFKYVHEQGMKVSLVNIAAWWYNNKQREEGIEVRVLNSSICEKHHENVSVTVGCNI